MPHVEQKCLVKMLELLYGVSGDRSGFDASGSNVILKKLVSNDPETRREMLQLQRFVGSGKEETGTLKV